MRARSMVPVLLAVGLTACTKERAPTAPARDELAMQSDLASEAGMSLGRECKTMLGTIYGKLARTPEVAWVGTVLLSLDGGAPLHAAFITRNNTIEADKAAAGKPFRGTETTTLTLPDGAFDFHGSFLAIPVSTPGLYDLNESGDIANGTGTFAGASGRAIMRGPFVAPFADREPLFIGRIHGSLCGTR
jgi:hypothetical protein